MVKTLEAGLDGWPEVISLNESLQMTDVTSVSSILALEICRSHQYLQGKGTFGVSTKKIKFDKALGVLSVSSNNRDGSPNGAYGALHGVLSILVELWS